jgi:predicted ester cyclase
MIFLQINQPTRKVLNSLWKAFPDIIITFDDIVIEGNRVACRYNLSGTHKGQFEDLRQPINNSGSMV